VIIMRNIVKKKQKNTDSKMVLKSIYLFIKRPIYIACEICRYGNVYTYDGHVASEIETISFTETPKFHYISDIKATLRAFKYAFYVEIRS